MALVDDLQSGIDVGATAAAVAITVAIRAISAYLHETIIEGDSDETDQAILLYANNFVTNKRLSRDGTNSPISLMTNEIKNLIEQRETKPTISVSSSNPSVNMYGV